MVNVNVQFVAKSSNAKTGPIPVTTSARTTCPPTCPLINNGCYASAGYYTRLNWDKVTDGARGGTWSDLCDRVAALPAGQVWRHNVAGDLPHANGRIEYALVRRLIEANTGKRGFTYTHHDMTITKNRAVISSANKNGFVINLSGNNPDDADRLHALDVAPVVTIVPENQLSNFTTKAGNRVVICPAVVRDGVNCASCKMCALPSRKTIIGFPAHGAQKSKINLNEVQKS